ncbi:MAG: hypothetical protein GEU94_15985, partial [Micromonosporaceae bacterium]|nr:hypothetical protein [Micromonosporaceae bacterium]
MFRQWMFRQSPPPATSRVARSSVVLAAASLVALGGVVAPQAVTAAVVPEFGMDHVVFTGKQLDLLTTGDWAQYVHDDRDSFMLLSGNNNGDISCLTLNSWARTLRSHYPNAPLYAATSGIRNIRNGAPCLNKSLFAGMMMVYEPNQANAPEFSWDRSTTERIFRDAAKIMRDNGVKPWSKPSGRAAKGRDHYGDWDYGALGN